MTLASQQLKLADITMEELVGSLKLIGLTEDNQTLTMVLDHSDKPFTQDLVKNRLMAEYNHPQIESETVSSKTASVVSSKPNQTHGELICGYCKKKGHIKRNCFKRKASEARKAQKNKNSPKHSTKVPTKVNFLHAALHSKQWDSSGT
jgi:hypothetical protein